MNTQYIMVCTNLGVRVEFPKSLSGSMKDCITKYLTNYVLVDDFNAQEFEQALMVSFMDADDINVEVWL